MKYNYFVLGYNGIDYFNSWFDPNNFPNTNVRIIDNGKQQIPDNLKQYVVHQNRTNIGCSGGWNIACDIAFKHLGLEKIIIGQEDARVSEDIFETLMEQGSPTQLCGTYNNSFEFSTYVMHRDIFNTVGRFDENFVFVGCEDNDYKHRCKLNGIDVNTLGVSHMYNASIANNNNVIPTRASRHNADYIQEKWNDYTYGIPFNGKPTDRYTDYFIELYGTPTVWPSEIEFNLYKEKQQ